MTGLLLLRCVAWLKRLTVAQEGLLEIERERLEFERLSRPAARPIRHAEFSVATYGPRPSEDHRVEEG